MFMQPQCGGGQCPAGMMHGWAGHMEGHGPMGHCSCGSGCGGNEMEKSKMGELMEKVHFAKEMLLKEKIKVRLEAKIGKKLDKMADLAVEMLLNKWSMKQEKYAMKEAMMDKLESIWTDGKK